MGVVEWCACSWHDARACFLRIWTLAQSQCHIYHHPGMECIDDLSFVDCLCLIFTIQTIDGLKNMNPKRLDKDFSNIGNNLMRRKHGILAKH